MPQDFQVLRCVHCVTYQVHPAKKSKKWACKVCGEKQSYLKIYGSGTGADCRKHVQKLNMSQGQAKDQARSAGLMNETSTIDKSESHGVCDGTIEVVPPSLKWDKYLMDNNQDCDTHTVDTASCGDERLNGCQVVLASDMPKASRCNRKLQQFDSAPALRPTNREIILSSAEDTGTFSDGCGPPTASGACTTLHETSIHNRSPPSSSCYGWKSSQKSHVYQSAVSTLQKCHSYQPYERPPHARNNMHSTSSNQKPLYNISSMTAPAQDRGLVSRCKTGDDRIEKTPSTDIKTINKTNLLNQNVPSVLESKAAAAGGGGSKWAKFIPDEPELMMEDDGDEEESFLLQQTSLNRATSAQNFFSVDDDEDIDF